MGRKYRETNVNEKNSSIIQNDPLLLRIVLFCRYFTQCILYNVLNCPFYVKYTLKK